MSCGPENGHVNRQSLLITRGGVMRDCSASLAPQAFVVYDAFSRTTAEEVP
jgi:hypothetical protein